jgi:hypothetical protein
MGKMGVCSKKEGGLNVDGLEFVSIQSPEYAATFCVPAHPRIHQQRSYPLSSSSSFNPGRPSEAWVVQIPNACNSTSHCLVASNLADKGIAQPRPHPHH